MEIEGKVALVTGGAKRLGRHIALALAERGAELVIHYRDSAREAHEVLALLKKAGGKPVAVRGDVSIAADVDRIVETAMQTFGRIDILVNNAGVGKKGSVGDTTEEDWDRIMAVNLKSVFLLSKAVLDFMKQQKWGRIINIGSVVAKTSTNARPWLDPQSSSKAGGGVYAASKAGVHTITRTLAKELVAFGITVNCIAPGPISTPMVPALPEPLKEQMPVKRIGQPEEISAFVVLLASERAGFTTGEIIDVNGGLWMD